jgi:hypothetical protein
VFLNAENTATTINGATISAAKGHAIQLNSIGASGSPALLTISDGVVTSACDYVSNGGTIFVANSGTASTLYPTVLIEGGEVNNTSTTIGIAIRQENANGKLQITGGTVLASSVATVSSQAITSSGILTISGGTVSATGSGVSRQAILTTGTVTVSGGTVEAINTVASNYSSVVAISNDLSGTVNVNGAATVSSTNGFAISSGINTTVTVSGGTVTASGGHGTCIGNAGTLTISTGIVSATTNGDRALSNSGTVYIQGGTISALDGMAIENGGTVTVSSGTVNSANTNSAYGTIFNYDPTSAIRLQGGTVTNTVATNNAVFISGGYLQLGNSTVSGLINVLDTDYPKRGLWSNYAGDNSRIHTFHVRRTATPFMGQAGDIIFTKDSIDNVIPSTNAENILPFFDISNAIKITGLVLIAAPDGDLELGATQYFIPVNRRIRARFQQ